MLLLDIGNYANVAVTAISVNGGMPFAHNLYVTDLDVKYDVLFFCTVTQRDNRSKLSNGDYLECCASPRSHKSWRCGRSSETLTNVTRVTKRNERSAVRLLTRSVTHLPPASFCENKSPRWRYAVAQHELR